MVKGEVTVVRLSTGHSSSEVIVVRLSHGTFIGLGHRGTVLQGRPLNGVLK